MRFCVMTSAKMRKKRVKRKLWKIEKTDNKIIIHDSLMHKITIFLSFSRRIDRDEIRKSTK